MIRRKRATALELSTSGQPVSLDDLPITEPETERSLLEKNGHLTWIMYLSKGRRSFFLPDGDRLRISQVYRLCYEQAQNPSIITAFVGYFPGVAFESSWLATLVRLAARQSYDEGCELMIALSKGFRRAATPTRIGRQIRRGRLEAARCARRQIQQQLADFSKSIDQANATPEFVIEQVLTYVRRLITGDPRLEPLCGRLLKMLKQARHYEASVLIAATQFNVRIRDLETSPIAR